MAAPRRLTIEQLRDENVNSDIFIVERVEEAPNFVIAQCLKCKDTFQKRITSIRGGKKIICYNCNENLFRKQANDAGLELIGKPLVDKGRSNECDYRLYRIIKCGHTKEMTLSTVRTSGVGKCLPCEEARNKELCLKSGFEYVSKFDKDSVTAKCLKCGTVDNYQVSNLNYNRSARCRTCKNKEDGQKESFVYLFRISSEDLGDFLKIGKSNNPYLRHLMFNPISKVVFSFLGKRKFTSELQALIFEKYLHNKYEQFRIPSELARKVFSNGFTECYTTEIQEDVLNDIKERKKP